MFTFAFHERTKAKARAAIKSRAKEFDDDMLTDDLQRAIATLLDAMPDAPKDGSVLVSVQGNVPAGVSGNTLAVTISYHDEDLTVS